MQITAITGHGGIGASYLIAICLLYYLRVLRLCPRHYMLSVLVVEDHQAVRDALVEAFQGWNYTVQTASTMEEAVAHLSTRRFDLVVTDVDLGGSSGLELLRLSGTPQPRPPFIVISGRFGPKEILASGFEVGDRLKYLQKPFLLTQLQTVVAELERRGSTAND
ncbi:MAG TPA: response regulator [Candidatus Angelobacter sp.]|nr:response regulator [Candidatus Angelobacter sp.]